MEFVFLEQKSSQLNDLSESMNKFRQQICDLENCSFNAILPDVCVFNGLVKRWLRELGDNTDEMLEALFVFQNSIAGSTNQVSCKLCNSINHIMDGLSPCMSFCSDDIPQNNTDASTSKESLSYDFTRPQLGMNSNDMDSMKVGKHTLTIEEYWRSWRNFRQVTSVHFNITERTNLASLNEGVVVGRPYIVIPSVGQEMDAAPEESDRSQSNDRSAFPSNNLTSCWQIALYFFIEVTAISKSMLEMLRWICILILASYLQTLWRLLVIRCASVL